jgi:hypothetical protein
MSQKLRVSMESPQSGWMSLSLRAGDEALLMVASHAPDDSLRDLIVALSALLSGSREMTVRWNCEPEAFDFRLIVRGSCVELRVVRYPDHHRRQKEGRVVLSLRGSKMEIGVPFWRALRDLGRRVSTDVFESNWRRTFPQRELQQLTSLIRALKHEARAETRPVAGID